MQRDADHLRPCLQFLPRQRLPALNLAVIRPQVVQFLGRVRCRQRLRFAPSLTPDAGQVVAESSGSAFWGLFESGFGSAMLNEPVEPLPKKTEASDVVRSSQSAK
jgi:hypothetical protein